jgi:hypothetical protein
MAGQMNEVEEEALENALVAEATGARRVHSPALTRLSLVAPARRQSPTPFPRAWSILTASEQRRHSFALPCLEKRKSRDFPGDSCPTLPPDEKKGLPNQSCSARDLRICAHPAQVVLRDRSERA